MDVSPVCGYCGMTAIFETDVAGVYRCANPYCDAHGLDLTVSTDRAG